MSQLLGRATRESLHELDVRPLAPPQATPEEPARGKPLTARLQFSIWPDLGAVEFDGLRATTRERPVTESDIGETLEHLRTERAKPAPLENRGIRDGDFVVGDLEETKAVESGPAGQPNVVKDLGLQVGTETYHPSLHEALQGAGEGDTVIATASFGAESPDPERAGRAIRAAFTVKQARVPVLPPLDDAFARELGAANLLALRGDIRDRLRKQAAQEAKRDVAEQLVAALLEKNPVEPPEPLVERDLEHRLRLLASNMSQRGVPADQVREELKKHLDAVRAQCQKTVSTVILMDALADQEEIAVAESTVEERLAQEASASGKTSAALRAAMEKDGRLEGLRTQLRRDATVDFLRERAEVTEAPDPE